MRDQKVHGNVLTVHKLVHCISDLLGQPLAIQVEVVLHMCVCVGGGGGGGGEECHYAAKTLHTSAAELHKTEPCTYLMEESCSCEDHRQLTCIVGVVEPVSGVTYIVCMKSSRESNHSLSSLPPHPSGQCSSIVAIKTMSKDMCSVSVTHRKANWISSCLR